MATVKMGQVDIKQVGAPSVKSRPDAGPKPKSQEAPIRVKGNLNKLNRADLEKTDVDSDD
jgi:hypothetical protein